MSTGSTPHVADNGGSMADFWKRLFAGARRQAPDGEAVATARDWKRIDALLRKAAHENDGEANARARVAELQAFYAAAGDADKRRFMDRLARDFTIDDGAVRRCIQAYLDAAADPQRARAGAALADSLESLCLRILRQFNLLPDGIQFLVGLRADLFRLSEADELLALDQDLLRLFAAWFDVGFLELRRIGWSSPASLLEKLIRYEAVHEIKSWSDLRNRLDSDRRCYAFFHGRMPDEPLIFVEVALVHEIATSVQTLLDEAQPTLDPAAATTAIFYSISNAQPGLRGVSMGEFLIKRVVQQLMQEYPGLKAFATLSPIPGFGRWIDKRLTADAPPADLPADIEALLAASGKPRGEALRLLVQRAGDGPRAPLRRLQAWLTSECAYYLLEEKQGRQPLDPVARFHFSNGASLGQINWLADSSAHGLAQSCGLMVNYLYQLPRIDDNHKAYARDRSLAAAAPVDKARTAACLRRQAGTPESTRECSKKLPR